MIGLNEIIDIASKLIKEGNLILHTSMTFHSSFKIYKEFSYDLYLLKDGTKTLLYSYKENKPVSAKDDLHKVWRECDLNYIEYFLKWILSPEFKELKKDGI